VGIDHSPIYGEVKPEKKRTLQKCKESSVTFYSPFRLVITLISLYLSNSSVDLMHLKRKEIIMYDPIDSVVRDVKGNLGFIDKVFSRATLLIGTVGIVVVLAFIVFSH
jgi:hypothetical protein